MQQMKMYSFLLILLISSCASNKLTSKDFTFKIEERYESSYDSYDLKQNEFQRNYTNGLVHIKVKLNNQEKVLINKYFEEFNFVSFPDEFKSVPNQNGEIDLSDFPGTTIKITLKLNHKFKSVLYNSSDTSEDYKNRTKKFIQLKTKIWQIIKEKKEVKNMKESDFEYL